MKFKLKDFEPIEDGYHRWYEYKGAKYEIVIKMANKLGLVTILNEDKKPMLEVEYFKRESGLDMLFAIGIANEMLYTLRAKIKAKGNNGERLLRRGSIPNW